MRTLVLVLAIAGCIDPLDGTTEQAAVVPVPTIAQALACGAPGSVPPLPAGTDLQRVNLDLTVFPDAKCNDGTGAAFFFRPASTLAGRSRWAIELQGGGGCHSGDDCARRWCSVGTNFGMDQMSASLLPPNGTRGSGILYRGPGASSPLSDANHVFLKYCTSDMHAGHSGPQVIDAHDPINGAPVQFMLEFEGQAVFDAMIATLRRDGASPPAYTLGGGAVVLADLDDATEVDLAGASAGGGGVINNVDRLGDLLRAHNTACGGGVCPLEYRALIDSTFGPSNETLLWGTSPFCMMFGACNWQDVLAMGTSMYTSHGDDSCESWHAANAPATSWLCDDTDHVLRNHVTTPFMLRQGLRDHLLSDNAIANGAASPSGAAMTLAVFAQLVRDQLTALSTLPATAEEGAAIAAAPAVFGPPCPWHDTLESNLQVFNALATSGGAVYSMFNVYLNWLNGGTPTSVIYNPGDPFVCP